MGFECTGVCVCVCVCVCVHRYVATASADRTIKVWDLQGGFCTHSLTAHRRVYTHTHKHTHARAL